MVEDCWETPRGRYDVGQQQFSLSDETKVIEPVGNKEWHQG
jgi:hypothetical protein